MGVDTPDWKRLVHVFAVTLVGLGVAGVVAAVEPARRASRVDPIVTLRCE
jgi:ABC-type lipoprotein release transport system permease subunit